MKKSLRLTRRDFLRVLGISTLDVIFLATCGVGYGALMEPNSFQVETVRLNLPRLSLKFSGLRVAQISDIHMGGWMNPERFRSVADLILAERPDLLERISKMVDCGPNPCWERTNGSQRGTMGSRGAVTSENTSSSRWQGASESGRPCDPEWDLMDPAHGSALA